ncbi:MAG: putative Ig domain-containing protein, partial [Candidatus Sericytochromatia bacterium]|nr:putative Ig domain-containing protein [Candidatus Tanganyikabacteria bacterium]
ATPTGPSPAPALMAALEWPGDARTRTPRPTPPMQREVPAAPPEQSLASPTPPPPRALAEVPAIGDQVSAAGDVVSVALGLGPAGAGASYRATGLPAGLRLDPASGIVSGRLPQSTAGVYRAAVSLVPATPGRPPQTRTFRWVVSSPRGPFQGRDRQIGPFRRDLAAHAPEAETIEDAQAWERSPFSREAAAGMLSEASEAADGAAASVAVVVCCVLLLLGRSPTD